MNITQFKLETINHIRLVQKHLNSCAIELMRRGLVHDDSKLEEPEASKFAEITDKMKDTTFGSPEYLEQKKSLGVALEHHYKNNDHHIEHYENGIAGMDLMALVEMFCDWAAAVKRNKDGDLNKSIEYHKSKYGLSDDLCSILRNSIKLVD